VRPRTVYVSGPRSEGRLYVQVATVIGSHGLRPIRFMPEIAPARSQERPRSSDSMLSRHLMNGTKNHLGVVILPTRSNPAWSLDLRLTTTVSACSGMIPTSA